MKSSNAMRVLEAVWTGCRQRKQCSWRKLNASMQAALDLCIKGGIQFARADFERLNGEFGFGYWAGDANAGYAERWYSSAVEAANLSAALSFEGWKKRAPFLFFLPSGRAAERIILTRLTAGAIFHWKGEIVTVTSISRDGESLTACSYKGHDMKILHRHKITRQMLARERKILERARLTDIPAAKEAGDDKA